METFTPEMIAAGKKCRDDPLYFIEHALGYDVPLIDVDHILDVLTSNAECILNMNMRLTAAYFIWYLCVEENKSVLCGFNTNDEAVMFKHMVQDYYDNMPSWLKPALTYKNNYHMELSNGCKIHSQYIGNQFGRGKTLDKIYIHNFHLLKKNVKDDLWLPVPIMEALGIFRN